MWYTKIKAQQGQALVEMALVLPILLLIVFGIIEFGRVYTYQLEINSIARQGARTAAVSSAANYGDVANSMMDLILETSESRTAVDGSVTVPSTGSVGAIIVTSISRDNSAPPNVVSTVTLPVRIYAPVIAQITGDPVILSASVTMRIQ
ncbi:MAG TPA: pilus assembly protein [Syntrophomonadaceae bacterium]|nr:pilus assembly protein [Syntrophomonadaceae bacterium]HPR92807.1 pilus assembly protein [Syntrophomonadaceae bacterium]